MKNIVVIGAGGFGREVIMLIEDINKVSNEWNIVGFVDDNPEILEKKINGIEVVGNIDWLSKQELFVINAIGDGNIREKINERLIESKNTFATLIHPTVITSSSVTIGEGTIICAGNIITTNISIGKHVIINLSCTIGHDDIIQDYVTILPGSNISGFVNLEAGVTIGTGTQVIQNLVIGVNTLVGAGATVVKDLPANCTAVGSPAKPIKYNK